MYCREEFINDENYKTAYCFIGITDTKPNNFDKYVCLLPVRSTDKRIMFAVFVSLLSLSFMNQSVLGQAGNSTRSGYI